MKTKNFNLNTTSVNNLITDLERLSSDISGMQDSIVARVAALGADYLNNAYNNRIMDPNITKIAVQVLPTQNGYKLISTGRDVLYEEFGTGDKGEQSPHPDKNKYNLNDYNSGPFILDVMDAHNQDYLDILAQNGITSGKYWIYRKGGKKYITQGVPAGMEMYKTSKYLKDEGIKKAIKEKASDVLSKV